MSKTNELVKKLTAFQSWDEMREAMLGGYVPTIRLHTKESRLLNTLIQVAGYRTWNPKK